MLDLFPGAACVQGPQSPYNSSMMNHFIGFKGLDGFVGLGNRGSRV